MLLVLFYVAAALALGGYTTYLLATGLPQSLLDRASRDGRFAGLYHDHTPADVSDTTFDPQTSAQPVSDRNASGC